MLAIEKLMGVTVENRQEQKVAVPRIEMAKRPLGENGYSKAFVARGFEVFGLRDDWISFDEALDPRALDPSLR